MPRAISPGPVGLKFWKAPGLSADNTVDDTNNLPAGISDQFNPWGPKRPVQDWFLSTSPALVPLAPFTLTGDAGSYTSVGTAAGLTVNDPLNMPAGLTGHYVPWPRPYPVLLLTRTGGVLVAAEPVTFTAGSGSYTISGAGAGLTIPGGLVAASGSYILTGSDAALTVSGAAVNMPAGLTGSFNPWGRRFPVNLRTSTGRTLAETAAPVVLTAAGGSYVITGTAAALTVTGAVTLTAAAGSYSITGSSAALALRLTANSGSYTVSGSAAVLARRFAAGAGAYAILGIDAQLRVAGSITLTAAAGSYSITGTAAALALRLTANSGSYTVSGSAAVLARRFAAGAGAYAILGIDAQLRVAGSITLTAAAGSYSITGTAATLIASDGLSTPVERRFKIATENRTAMVVAGTTRGKVPKDQRIAFVN